MKDKNGISYFTNHSYFSISILRRLLSARLGNKISAEYWKSKVHNLRGKFL
jgi:hypothetical protein